MFFLFSIVSFEGLSFLFSWTMSSSIDFIFLPIMFICPKHRRLPSPLFLPPKKITRLFILLLIALSLISS